MSGSVKVERRHREAACEVTNWEGTTSCTTAFIAGDPSLCTCKGDSYPWRNKVRIAQAIADAEHRGRLAERADVVEWLRSPGKSGAGGWREEAWAKDIEEGGHVGQAEEESADG